MGEYNAALNIGHDVVVDGKTWTLTDLTPRIRGAFESWLEDGVLETIVGLKGKLSPDDYRADLAEHTRSLKLKKYKWGNEYCREALTSQEGYAHLFRLLLSKKHPEVMGWQTKQVEELFGKSTELFREQMKNILENPKEEEPAMTPAATT